MLPLTLILELVLATVAPQLSFTRYTAREGFPQHQTQGIAQDSKGHILICSGDTYSFDGYFLKKIEEASGISGFFPLPDGKIAAPLFTQGCMMNTDGEWSFIPTEERIRSVRETSDGRQWFISDAKILLRKGNEFERIPVPSGEFIHSSESSGGKIYLGAESGTLYCYDPISRVLSKEFKAKSRINVIYYCKNGKIGLGTRGDGLYLISRDSEEVVHLSKDLCSGNVLSLCEDDEGILWVGTLNGLNLVSGGEVLGSYTNESDNENSLSHNTVRRMFRDSQGGMWLGTYFGGINYWHPSRKAVFNILPRKSPGNLNDIVASCISESRDGLIWIGTNQGGVNCYDSVNEKVIRQYLLPKASDNLLTFNDVKAIYHHPDGNRIFIGAHGNGLNVLDRTSGVVTRLPSPSYIEGISLESENLLLLRTGNVREYRYEISSGKFDERKNVSPGRDLLSEIRDSLGLTKEFPRIEGCARDLDGDLWLSTTLGLYCSRGSSLLKFSRANGLVTDFFLPGSVLLSSEGKLYIGGVGGVSVIDPPALKYQYVCPPAEVSKIVVSGNNREFPSDSLVVLHHSDNNISLYFSSPDFAAAGTNIFEYKLEGLDSDWRRAGLESVASYSKLPSGLYTLKVRVSRHGETWTESPRLLRIRVFPVWYFSWIAIICWILLFGASLFYFMYLKLKKKEAENKLALHEMEKRYSREISKLKVLRILNASRPEGSEPVDTLSPDDERFLTRAMSLVEMNINNVDYSTDDLAVGLAVSRSTLHKYMKSATGDSALAFIHKIRFSRACELLEKGELTISEICYKTGFSSPAYFSASFRKFVGCSPQEYIKRIK